MREMLGRLRNRRLIRIQWHDDAARFGESQVEILPTLPRVIPFEDAAAWEQQAGGSPGSAGRVTGGGGMSQRISLTRIIAIHWYGFRQILDVEQCSHLRRLRARASPRCST